MQTTNPDYPPDYDEYLADCYDTELGETTKSYEAWKAARSATQTNGHRGGEG